MKTKAFSREERQAMITAWFALRIQKGNEKFATMNEIARGLGMSPSTHLQKIISGMCFKGQLMWRDRKKAGRWDGKEFMLMEGTFKRPQPRQIALKIRGVNQGQLELPL